MIALLALLVSGSAAAQDHFALEITAPRDDLPTNHRMTKCYTGITCSFRVAAIGGDWPYTYSLTNPGSGMTVEAGPCTTNGLTCTAGTITWVNPSSNATPTIQVCDRDSDCVSETWTITVGTSATNWKFVDAVAGNDGNAGTLASPWQTLDKVYDSSADEECVVFRAGTYTTTGIPTSDSGLDLEIEWAATKAACWIGYPGEAVTFDFLSDGVEANYKPRLTFAATDLFWLQNATVEDIHVVGFQFTQSTVGPTFWDVDFQHLYIGVDGSNAGFILTSISANQAYGIAVQNCTFTDNRGVSSSFKFYSTNKSLVADSVFDTSDSEAAAFKAANIQFTMRNSRFVNIDGYAIDGNWAEFPASSRNHTGEILFNNVLDDGGLPNCAINVNQQGEAGATYIYRNTFQGCQYVRNVATDTGPFTWATNVIVNNNTNGSAPCPALKAYCESVTDYSRIVDSGNNLTGVAADGIVNSGGELQGAYLVYLGLRGWQLTAPSGSTGPVRLRRTGH